MPESERSFLALPLTYDAHRDELLNPTKVGSIIVMVHASVKALCTWNRCEVSISASYSFLHCELNHYPASQMGMLKPIKVKGHDQDYKAILHISFGKHLQIYPQPLWAPLPGVSYVRGGLEVLL